MAKVLALETFHELGLAFEVLFLDCKMMNSSDLFESSYFTNRDDPNGEGHRNSQIQFVGGCSFNLSAVADGHSLLNEVVDDLLACHVNILAGIWVMSVKLHTVLL